MGDSAREPVTDESIRRWVKLGGRNARRIEGHSVAIQDKERETMKDVYRQVNRRIDGQMGR